MKVIAQVVYMGFWTEVDPDTTYEFPPPYASITFSAHAVDGSTLVPWGDPAGPNFDSGVWGWTVDLLVTDALTPDDLRAQFTTAAQAFWPDATPPIAVDFF